MADEHEAVFRAGLHYARPADAKCTPHVETAMLRHPARAVRRCNRPEGLANNRSVDQMHISHPLIQRVIAFRKDQEFSSQLV